MVTVNLDLAPTELGERTGNANTCRWVGVVGCALYVLVDDPEKKMNVFDRTGFSH